MFGANKFTLLLLTIVLSGNLNASSIKVLTYSVAPFASQVDGQKQGYLIELVDALFKQANIPYEVNFLPLKRAMVMATQHTNMCVLPVQRSQEIESHFSWISPVMISRYGLFSRSDKTIPIQVLDDAKLMTIGSYLGSGISEYLRGFDYRIEYTSHNVLSLKQLERGYIDLWAAELMTAKNVMQSMNIKLGEPELIFYTAIGAMACHPDMSKTQQKALKLALKQLHQTGFIDMLNSKYGM